MTASFAGPSLSKPITTGLPREVIPATGLVEPSLRDVWRDLRRAIPRIRLAWALTGIASIAALAQVAGLVAMVVRYGWTVEVVPLFIWGPLFLSCNLVGLLILSRWPKHRIGWILCLSGTIWVAAQVFSLYGYVGVVVDPGSLPNAAGVANMGGFYPFGLYLLLVELLLIFPNGLLARVGWRYARWAGIAGATGATLETMFGTPVLLHGDFGAIPNPWHISDASLSGQVLNLVGVGFFLMFAMGIPAAISMVRRLRRAKGTEHVQLQWIAWNTVLLAVAYVVHLVAVTQGAYETAWGWIPNASWGLALNSLAIVTGIAILRHHLFDVDVIVSRTLVYSLLTAGVALCFFLTVIVSGTMLDSLVDIRGGQLAVSIVVTTAIALLLQPLRDRLQVMANRLVYGERDRPDVVLSRLGDQLEASATPEAILPQMTRTIVEALKLPHVAVALGEGTTRVVVAESGVPGDVQVGFPMQYQGMPIGELRVTPRTPGEGFSREDRRVLANIARQAATAAYTIGVSGDLRRAREALVTAREEERRRLRRDLHDGLGAQLAACVMQARVARKMLAQDGLAADRVLNELQEELRAAIVDIRRLVHGLRPPALDELGLVAALRSRLFSFQRGDEDGIEVAFHAPEPFPYLPAAMEVAVFRIVEEAVTNATRHAGADSLTVSLVCDNGVSVRIEDDGVGMPAEFRAGVGLVSMRERTDELGGTLAVLPRVGGGTSVEAWFPLPSMEGDR